LCYSFQNGYVLTEITTCKSNHQKASTKRVSTWSESTISIGSFSEGKHLEDNTSQVNGDSQLNVIHRYKSCDDSDAKSLADSVEDELERSKSDPENDDNKRKSLMESESIASGHNSNSTHINPHNDVNSAAAAARTSSAYGDSVFEGDRSSAVMNHSVGSVNSVGSDGIATKAQKWAVIRLFR